MEKKKRWHFFVILSLILLTIYNVLPTVFYYAHPLKKTISQERGMQIGLKALERVNSLEEDSIEWISSFCKLIRLKPLKISSNQDNRQFVDVQFKNVEEASLFRKFFPEAGNLIDFVPAKLSIYDQEVSDKTVTVQRKIPIHFEAQNLNSYLQFGSKKTADGKISSLYKGLIIDRAIQLGVSLAGTSEIALQAQASIAQLNTAQGQELLLFVSQNLVNFAQVFGENSPMTKRYFASFTQIEGINKSEFIDSFITALQKLKDKIQLEKISLSSDSQTQILALLKSRENLIIQAETLLKNHRKDFITSQQPWNYARAGSALKESPFSEGAQVQMISLEDQNPFVEHYVIDWANDQILLKLYPDLVQARENSTPLKEQVDQLVYNAIAEISRQSGEEISPFQNQFQIALSDLPESKTFLTLRLYSIAQAKANDLREIISLHWSPEHPDLKKEVFPIWDYETYQKLPLDQKSLGLLVFAPSMYNTMPPKGFKMNSIYVIAKGVDKILERVSAYPGSEASEQFLKDFRALEKLMQINGFFGYSANSFAISSEFAGDFIFEGEDYYQSVLVASRENFQVHGTKRYAVLEFTNVEQRILAENKIDNAIHEELLKWRDDYRSAQVDIRKVSKYAIPSPTKNVLWDNFKLSFVKYFRGDERKILHWGLDMSGGKTVQIELLYDQNKVVSKEADIRQGINELYSRVNKMGVSEVSIRQEGNTIALDFPGSQALSANELIKASSMYFHVINEQFMSNAVLKEATAQFLQEIWNEAVITNCKSAEEINRIASKHLYGASLNPDRIQPRSPAAKTLYDHGLRLAIPQENQNSSAIETTFSKIGIFRGDDYSNWYGQSNPLVIVFKNYALEGSNLEDVRASYDPTKGNCLTFGVKSVSSLKERSKFNPRDDFEAWTSQFSKEKILGTAQEIYTQGKGWRMAVILNGYIITAPSLDSSLRDRASITGSFTQQDINRLEADLKAGSLSFTPKILSEKNVSPELGAQERFHGVIATLCSLFLAILTMILYYRFGGVIASIAVLFNLLMMWAVLQNMGATLTLAGIAGVILTVAMAVDANVLVFERIREEFALSGKLASAVHAGYRKAFSAILDSNITTIIAALILMNFDSGPIRGLALVLIIGIVSSLVSALFMTRFFFSYWVRNPLHKELKMANLIRSTSFNFLKYTKPTVFVTALIVLVGSYLLVAKRETIFGMDFTGGYALSIELPVQEKTEYRQEVEKALVEGGLSLQDFQVRELNPANHIRLFLSKSLNLQGKPFYNMPLQADLKDAPFTYQNNPRISWIVEALKNNGIVLSPDILSHLNGEWTAISGQLSDSMKTNAILGILVALICILFYITFRFEFKYAISATLCLAHDLLFCVGVIAILHALGVAIQIDLHIVAALMTIIGYSLNDTIIVFDRIREDSKKMHKASFTEVINHALNITLSRTLMTSGITLLVLLPLIFLGGSILFGFALVMAIGVVFGTLSSLFIAAPLMQYFHRREMLKDEKLVADEH